MDNTQFFYRTVIFSRNHNQVALADIDQPENVTALEAWLGIVVALADGAHSIQDLIDYLGTQYHQAPDRLEKTLYSVIERLVDGKIIGLSNSAVSLPYYLVSPIEELDIEKARKLIRQDGYKSPGDELH